MNKTELVAAVAAKAELSEEGRRSSSKRCI